LVPAGAAAPERCGAGKSHHQTARVFTSFGVSSTQAILHLRSLVPEEVLEKVVGAEWWIESGPAPFELRPCNDGDGDISAAFPGAPFTFDNDDARYADDRTWTHPLLGSALWLSGLGGQMVIANQTRSPRTTPGAWLVQPEPRQFLLYRGSLLNAVLPAGQGTAAANCTHQPRRSILRVSWWGRECWHTPTTSCMRLKETSPHQPWMERIPVAPPSKTALWPWFSGGSSQAAPRCPLFAGELWAV
jgi:hypothetical protein